MAGREQALHRRYCRDFREFTEKVLRSRGMAPITPNYTNNKLQIIIERQYMNEIVLIFKSFLRFLFEVNHDAAIWLIILTICFLFFVMRTLLCWLWKINAIVEKLDSISNRLAGISNQLEKLAGISNQLEDISCQYDN